MHVPGQQGRPGLFLDHADHPHPESLQYLQTLSPALARRATQRCACARATAATRACFCSIWAPLVSSALASSALDVHSCPGAQGHAALCMRQDGEGHKGVFLTMWTPTTCVSVSTLNPYPCLFAQGHAALCMRQDGEGHKGVFLDHVGTKNTAAKTIAIALRSLGPHVLPWSEMVRAHSHAAATTGSWGQPTLVPVGPCAPLISK